MAGLLSIAVLIAWFAVAIWIAKRLTKAVKNSQLRIVLIFLCVGALLVLPVADEIIGGFQFRALCRENAVLRIDAEKIKGKTIRVIPEPTEGSRDAEGVAIRIYYYRLSYRDTETGEELASYSTYTARSGWLVRLFGTSSGLPPLTVHPSTCSPPNEGSLPKEFGFKFETRKT